MSRASRIHGISLGVLFLLRLGALEAREGLWGEERPLGAEINRSGLLNVTPCVSQDGLTLIYASSVRPAGPFDLWIATRGSSVEEFGDARELEHLNGPGTDESTPSLSGDSSTLYFRRTPGGRTRGEILVSRWLPEEKTFGSPAPVEGLVNTGAHETYPVIAPDERTLYFSRGGDLHVATRAERDQPFDQVTKLEDLNTGSDDFPTSLSSDGLTLFFARTDDFRSFANMWMATRVSLDEPFGEPARLPPPVNEGFRMFSPFVSADWPAPGSRLYFTRCYNCGCNFSFCMIYEATWHPDCDPDRPEECEGTADPDRDREVLLQSDSRARFGEKEFEYFFIEAEDFYDNDPRRRGASWLRSSDPASRWVSANDFQIDRATGEPVEADPGAYASGGESITNALVDSLTSNEVGPGRDIQYRVRFDTPGTYYLYIRHHSPLGPEFDRDRNDSFYYPTTFGEDPRQLKANGDDHGILEATRSVGDVRHRGAWVWFAARNAVERSEANPRSAQNPARFQEYEVTEDMVGEDLILEFDHRESGTMLDAFLFVEVDGGLPPTDGRGPDGTGFFGIGDEVDLEFGLANLGMEAPPKEPSFLRGDCNQDATVNLADAVCTLGWLFAGDAAPGCVAAADSNGDAKVDIADPLSLLNFLFTRGSAPVTPYPDCGPGTLPGDEELGCASPLDCR